MGGVRDFFKNVKTWQLCLVLLPLLFITATLLRFDHLAMLDLRAAVLEADAAEDDTRIAEALKALKDFTSSHTVINIVEKNGVERLTFGSGPFYLEYQYSRAAAAKIAEAEQNLANRGDENPNGNIYQKAREVCEPQAQMYGWAWNSSENISCWTAELSKYPSSDYLETQSMANIPSTDLYRYDFISPIWAPTPAGFITLICFLLIIIIVCRFAAWVILRFSVYILDTQPHAKLVRKLGKLKRFRS